MQNLCLLNTRTVSLNDFTGDNVIRRFAIDVDKQIVFLLTSRSIFTLSLDNETVTSLHTSIDATTNEDLCFLSELNHLCLGMSNGDLVSLQCDDDIGHELNVIGTVEECIHELRSSPDQQILVAVTAMKVLLLSTSNDYEPIAETQLDSNDFGEQQFVNVGWGSKATQFHGSLGKKAALESASSTLNATRSEHDDARSRVVWRDDGDLFAVSFLSSNQQWRSIKIFNKQGQLQATNESSLNGCIESALAWKTSGELIATAMRLNNGQKLTISFLEKNGLKHGEFVLESVGYVEHLAWNKDSTILALAIRQEVFLFVYAYSSRDIHRSV
jgi:elongator complex protein 1